MIEVDINTDELTRGLSRFTQQQLPYAFERTLNGAAFGVRDDIGQQLDTNFTIAPSKVRYMKSLTRVPREDRATKERLVAEVGIFDGRSRILTRHIDGGEKQKQDEVNPFFIPSDYMRPTDRSLPERKLYPKNLRLQDRRTADGMLYAKARRSSTGRLVIQGKHRTFVAISDKPGVTWGVYQRQGPDRDDVQILWLYKKVITLPPRLDWDGAVARQAEQLPERFVKELMHALRTAR